MTTDISKSRAAYWLGRTHEAAGRAKEANDWYGRASSFGQTFYGQLAARKLPRTAARLPTDPVTTDADRSRWAVASGDDGALSARRATSSNAAVPAAPRTHGAAPGGPRRWATSPSS